jgi:hypothetical protein
MMTVTAGIIVNLYSVRVLDNIKGELQGTVKLEQSRYANGDNSKPDDPLHGGAIYVFATLFSVPQTSFFDASGLMVSIIKTIDRKQLRPEDQVPFEYSGFRIEPYRTHIDEPGTSKNMVVVCTKDDLQTMAQHALIRADQIEGRKL